MGMVGGGPGAFIGQIHRMAAALTGEISLVCGAFSTDPAASREFGITLGLAPERSHPDYRALLAAEAALPPQERIDLLAVVTPNASHCEIACAALERGIAVFCEKPLATTVEEARQIAEASRRNARPVALAHTYAAYPMVIEARQRVRRGEIGAIRKIMVDYTQGWLAPARLPAEQKQAAWRMDPQRSGPSGCLGDIGVHAAHLAEYVTGRRITRLLADLGRTAGRALDDDAALLLRFDNGARGVLTASQISIGEENDLSFRIYGEHGHLRWRQQRPDSLMLAIGDGPVQVLRAGHSTLDSLTQAVSRLPPGHPEGYIESFANLYKEFCTQLRSGSTAWLPDVSDGVRGMQFIESAIRSSEAGGCWTPLNAEDAA
ncbi:MAG: Gfo/Idh/MocA family oxidoreductase [Rhodanobacteraceae bacterium]|nr:Gfo/Idh/MocA family oxidoreductase [Rhodanobacteraceae bacterium]